MHTRADGCRQGRWSRRCVCACASMHPCMPGCTSVDTNAHCTDGHTTHARADMHGGGSARPRPATPPRPPPHQRRAERPSARRGIGLSAAPDARAHTLFTHTHIRSRGLDICTHTCTHELAHTEIYVYSLALPPRARKQLRGLSARTYICVHALTHIHTPIVIHK